MLAVQLKTFSWGLVGLLLEIDGIIVALRDVARGVTISTTRSERSKLRRSPLSHRVPTRASRSDEAQPNQPAGNRPSGDLRSSESRFISRGVVPNSVARRPKARTLALSPARGMQSRSRWKSAVAGRSRATASRAALDGIVPLQCDVGVCRTAEATMDAAGRVGSRIRTRFIPRVLEVLTLWFIAVVALVLGYAQPASALHERCHGVVPSIVGTEGDDVIRGTSGPDVIFGLGGNDTIFGLGGDDLICAGDGDDMIFAGDGDDYANGNDGHDRIFGEAGNDFPLIGEGGDDKIFGGDGNDVLNGLPGDDVLVGGDGNDEILGWSGDDVVLAGAGDDVVTADEGNDFVFGGDGNDSLYGDARFPFDPVDVGTGNDWLFGQDGDDNLAGGPGIDSCDGGSGLDRTALCEVIVRIP
jgi:hypothetical protein